MDDEDTYETLEEAIAVAMAEVDPGGEIAVHDETCAVDDQGEGCTCEPVIVTRPNVRAEA
jgi:hypothetical protein